MTKWWQQQQRQQTAFTSQWHAFASSYDNNKYEKWANFCACRAIHFSFLLFYILLISLSLACHHQFVVVFCLERTSAPIHLPTLVLNNRKIKRNVAWKWTAWTKTLEMVCLCAPAYASQWDCERICNARAERMNTCVNEQMDEWHGWWCNEEMNCVRSTCLHMP